MRLIPIDVSDKIIHKFEILYAGWECDYEAAVCEKLDGTRYLITTNHGSQYVADPKEFEDHLKHYEETIKATKMALKLMEKK